jgi:hypothetical protein
MKIPPPQQISSVPEIDNGAMGWAGLLVDGLGKIRISELNFGIATITWPGGFNFSNVLQVAHGLSRQPTASGAVFVTINGLAQPGLNALPIVEAHAGNTAQLIGFQANTSDGQNPPNTATTGFYWLAIL